MSHKILSIAIRNTLKLTVLLCLVLFQRAQTIHTFDTRFLKITAAGTHVGFPDLLKHSNYKDGNHPIPLFIKKYHADRTICPHYTLKEYLHKTKSLRTKTIRKDGQTTLGQQTKLLLSFIKPYKEIGCKTVSRWLKIALAEAGIDTNVFQGHSVRAASSSKAKISGVPINNILKMAGWSNERTFATHYDKPIMDISVSNIT